MRTFTATTLILHLLAGWTLGRSDPTPNMGFLEPGVFMLKSPHVQRELKLTDEQVGKWWKLMKRIELGEASIQDATIKGLKEILSPEQFRRIRQIDRQERWAGAMLDADVRGELKLTDEQEATIQQIPGVPPPS